MGYKSATSSPLCRPFHRSNHFLDVEGSGEECKVHSDLVLAEVTEALLLHVVFHLPEDGLRLYGTVGPVLQAFFRGKPLPGLLLVFHQLVVGPDRPCRFPALIASPSSAGIPRSSSPCRRLSASGIRRPSCRIGCRCAPCAVPSDRRSSRPPCYSRGSPDGKCHPRRPASAPCGSS